MIDRHRPVGVAGRSAPYRRCSEPAKDQVESITPVDEADEYRLSGKYENNWGISFHL
jgi:hypothetical protein